MIVMVPKQKMFNPKAASGGLSVGNFLDNSVALEINPYVPTVLVPKRKLAPKVEGIVMDSPVLIKYD